jgi:hypothetical protein
MTSFPSDRPTSLLEITDSDSPLPPLTVSCSSAFVPGGIDVWWSDPSLLSVNTKFDIIGVNVYRSIDSEYGPYSKMNSDPVESNLFRDRINARVVIEEDVSGSFLAFGDTDGLGRYIFKTRRSPIHIQATIGKNSVPNNMFVTVDGAPARVAMIKANTGEVMLDSSPYFDVVSQQQFPAVLPTNSSTVLASYRWLDGDSKTTLMRRVFYKVTTVAIGADGEYFETPVKSATVCNNQEVESMDWIWREAIRRNRWILEQGGERVKVFIRKSLGVRCGCASENHKQASSDCQTCYGTGIIGGYEGPYDIIVAPDDAEKKSEQSNKGRTFSHSYETWTGPHPLLSQRDFIVKLNGDRYGIGPVRMPSNRGNQLQQFFNISHIDESDIRYKVPVLDTTTLVAPKSVPFSEPSGRSTPMITENPALGDDYELRGKSTTWGNQTGR